MLIQQGRNGKGRGTLENKPASGPKGLWKGALPSPRWLGGGGEGRHQRPAAAPSPGRPPSTQGNLGMQRRLQTGHRESSLENAIEATLLFHKFHKTVVECG